MDITRVLPPNGEKAQRSKGSHLSSQVGFKPLLARDTPCLFISWWCSILNCLQSRTEHSFSKFGVTHESGEYTVLLSVSDTFRRLICLKSHLWEDCYIRFQRVATQIRLYYPNSCGPVVLHHSYYECYLSEYHKPSGE